MGYLISQIVSALVVASLLGLTLGWLVRGLAAAREMERQEAIWQGRLRHALQRNTTTVPPPPREATVMSEHQPAPTSTPASADLVAARAWLESALSTLGHQIEGLTERLQRLEQTPRAAPETLARPALSGATLPSATPGHSRSAEADDLTRIRGVGPALSAALAAAGVASFAQIAAWSEADEARVVTAVKRAYRGRIPRATWVEEARQLAAGAVGTKPKKK